MVKIKNWGFFNAIKLLEHKNLRFQGLFKGKAILINYSYFSVRPVDALTL